MRPLILAFVALSACTGNYEEPEFPEPGELRAGVARVRMPVPVGIGTVGNGGFGVDSNPSPFSEIYPSTEHIHAHPDFKAVVVSRGDGHELVFVRSDTVGVFQQFRRAVVLEVAERTGRDIDDALLFGGTHTHSGPGRVIDGGGPYDLIADRFFPEFYDNMVDSVADAIEAAYEDLQPARVGYAIAESDDGHNDRRCEDDGGSEAGKYQNPDMPFIAIERNGEVDAVVFSYAVHGTVIGIDDLTLSQDVSGGIEQAIEARFDHPVEALFFNSWGADMSPGSPEVPTQEGAAVPGEYTKIRQVGYELGEALHASIGDVAWQEDPVIQAEIHRVPLSIGDIGYPEGLYPYDFGGVYCGQGSEQDCDNVVPWTEVPACVSFSEEFPAPWQTQITAGRLGDLHFVTFPGEPGTKLAEAVMDGIRADQPGVTDLMFFGYTQDYIGYSILEDDWWNGGYEAGGALWGPWQGEYLKENAIDKFGSTFGPSPVSDLLEPAPVEPFTGGEYTPWVTTPAVDVGGVVTQVNASYALTEVVEFAVKGTDPWLGAPLARLETDAGDPVTWPNGVAVDSDDQSFWVDLSVEPAYGDDENASERTFTWTYHLPTQATVPGSTSLSGGSYRLRVSIPGSADVISSVFAVE